jgi:hypothetical protein
MSAPSPLATTRESLHALAEHVLCAARYAAVRRIGLEVAHDGFATPPFGEHGRVVAVEGGELVVRESGEVRRAPITTLRAAGELVGIEPGGPVDVFPRVTPLDLDAPLRIDEAARARLMAWYALGDDALRRLRQSIPSDNPSPITLWPEHFDVAIRAADVNYGVSPGDGLLPDPYAYVGPDTVPAVDAYWNQPFGAARTWAELRAVDQAVAFFEEGRAALAGMPG